MTKTTEYNEIDLENFRQYSNVKIDTFWDSTVNVLEQLYVRYTKNSDTILEINVKNNSNISVPKRKIISADYNNIESSLSILEPNNKLQLIIAQPEFLNTDFDYKLVDNLKKVFNYLENNRFFILIAGDLYFHNELHLYGFQYANCLIQHGLQLKSVITLENYKPKIIDLWRYRALLGGFNIIKHQYIFVFRKVV